MDVTTIFLNGYLEKNIYIEQPLGFTSNDRDHEICKLQRSIYRLKQASQSWNARFNDVIKIFDSIKNKESYVYKKASGSTVTFLILYVDDILLIGNDILMLTSINVWLLLPSYATQEGGWIGFLKILNLTYTLWRLFNNSKISKESVVDSRLMVECKNARE